LAGTGEPLLLEPSGDGLSMLGDGEQDLSLPAPLRGIKLVGGRGDERADEGVVGRLAPGDMDVGR